MELFLRIQQVFKKFNRTIITMFQIRGLFIKMPELGSWEERRLPRSEGPGVTASSSFHRDGKCLVAYLTPGTLERLLRDIGEFKSTPSSGDWQQVTNVSRVQFGFGAAVKVEARTAGLLQVQYFFEIPQRSVAGEPALLAFVVSCSREGEEESFFDNLFQEMEVSTTIS